jgi:hypothetical protein
MDLVVGHVVGIVDDHLAAGHCTFQVADGAVGVGDGPAGDVVRPLAEFANDGADAVVVADQVRTMLRCGYVMAANAVIRVR